MRTDQKLFCLKSLLTVFLVLLWIMGSAVFGVLLWFRLDYWTNEYLKLDTSLERYLILIYVSMVDGGLMLVFSLFGLVGGLKTLKCGLIIYLTALCLAFGLTVAGSVYGFVYREELRNTLAKNDKVSNILQKYTGQPNQVITRAVDTMQSELKCCGADGPRYYLNSDWALESSERKRMAPASCCKDYLANQDSIKMCSIYTSLAIQDDDLNPEIQQQGCKTALANFFENNVLIVAGLAITIGALQLICLIITSILIHILNNLYVPQPDDIVYDMARNQEKSPYPSRGDYRDTYR